MAKSPRVGNSEGKRLRSGVVLYQVNGTNVVDNGLVGTCHLSTGSRPGDNYRRQPAYIFLGSTAKLLSIVPTNLANLALLQLGTASASTRGSGISESTCQPSHRHGS